MCDLGVANVLWEILSILINHREFIAYQNFSHQIWFGFVFELLTLSQDWASLLGRQAVWWILSHDEVLDKSTLEAKALLLLLIFVLLCFIDGLSILLIIINPINLSWYILWLFIRRLLCKQGKTVSFLKSWEGPLESFRDLALRLQEEHQVFLKIELSGSILLEIQVRPGWSLLLTTSDPNPRWPFWVIQSQVHRQDWSGRSRQSKQGVPFQERITFHTLLKPDTPC